MDAPFCCIPCKWELLPHTGFLAFSLLSFWLEPLFFHMPAINSSLPQLPPSRLCPPFPQLSHCCWSVFLQMLLSFPTHSRPTGFPHPAPPPLLASSSFLPCIDAALQPNLPVCSRPFRSAAFPCCVCEPVLPAPDLSPVPASPSLVQGPACRSSWPSWKRIV